MYICKFDNIDTETTRQSCSFIFWPFTQTKWDILTLNIFQRKILFSRPAFKCNILTTGEKASKADQKAGSF